MNMARSRIRAADEGARDDDEGMLHRVQGNSRGIGAALGRSGDAAGHADLRELMDAALTGVRGRRNALVLHGEFSAGELRAIADEMDGKPAVDVSPSEIDEVRRRLIRSFVFGGCTHFVCSTCGNEWKAEK